LCGSAGVARTAVCCWPSAGKPTATVFLKVACYTHWYTNVA
jgi:hypothetical protein